MKLDKSINKKEIEKYFIVDEENRVFSEFILDYLENATKIASSVSKSLYDSIVSFYNLDKDFIKQLEHNHFKENIIELDINKYLDNPYLKNIKLDNINDNNYHIKMESYKPYQGFLLGDLIINKDYHELIRIGYFTKEYKYPSLSINNNIWMLITPHEINTMQESIDNASGDVLVMGLGLGYYAYMVANKSDVKSVTIVENDKTIIELFNKYILPQFENKNKIKVVYEDATKFLEYNNNYDYCFVDLWHDNHDGMELYRLFIRQAKKYPTIRFDYWIESSFKATLNRITITLLYEEYNKLDIDYENAIDFYDTLINNLHNNLKDYKINNTNDIDKLLY